MFAYGVTLCFCTGTTAAWHTFFTPSLPNNFSYQLICVSRTKNEYIDWTSNVAIYLYLSRQWPWPHIFKIKYLIFYISRKMVCHEMKNEHIECNTRPASKLAINFTFHDYGKKWKHFPRYWPFVKGTTGHRWIPLTKASDSALWCFLWYAPEQTVEQTLETPMIWDAIALIMTSL